MYFCIFRAEYGIRYVVSSRGLGDVYRRHIHNGASARLDVDINQTRGRAKAVELAGIAGIGVAQRFHRRRSESDVRAKVKNRPLGLTRLLYALGFAT